MMNNCHQLVHFSFKLLLNLYTDGTVKIFYFLKHFLHFFFRFFTSEWKYFKGNFIFMDNERKNFNLLHFNYSKFQLARTSL